MAFQRVVSTQPDYDQYRFGRSRQIFRGPEPDLSGRYVACIGGAETFGKFSPVTYPQLLDEELDVPCANWGTPGAGPGFFLKDPVLLEACSRAEVCVVSIMSAHSMSNRLFNVFIRRNERLRSVSEMMEALYPEVDFGHFRFVGNMLNHLHDVSPERFNVVAIEMRNAWIARMRELLTDIEAPKVLLWFAQHHPEAADGYTPAEARRVLPGFVTRQMITEVAPLADVFVEYVAPPESAVGGAEDRFRSIRGEAVSRRFPSATMHREVATLLSTPIEALLIPVQSTDEEEMGRDGFWRRIFRR
ncbi:MAG: DUF6473 family protein [Pseudomonadota bacterium]